MGKKTATEIVAEVINTVAPCDCRASMVGLPASTSAARDLLAGLSSSPHASWCTAQVFAPGVKAAAESALKSFAELVCDTIVFAELTPDPLWQRSFRDAGDMAEVRTVLVAHVRELVRGLK